MLGSLLEGAARGAPLVGLLCCLLIVACGLSSLTLVIVPPNPCRSCQVIERRGAYELARARQRLHLVDGFLTAMRDLDAVVAAIRAAPDSAAAGAALQVGNREVKPHTG